MKGISVVGLGYVGLPLAVVCLRAGYHVTGIDSNEILLKEIESGSVNNVDSSTCQEINKHVLSGRFQLVSSAKQATACDVYLVCVPTPVDDNNLPDTSIIESAVQDIATVVSSGNIVVIESTVFPGSCEELILPILESVSGLKVGTDIQLAHCPERINPGDACWTVENIPRVVGSTTRAGNRMAAQFYRSVLKGQILDIREECTERSVQQIGSSELQLAESMSFPSVTMMRTIRDAEAVKAMENTVRDINIAVVNELAQISEVLELDLPDIIKGMETKPFGKGPYYPGVGVGGHCIAVDPEWLQSATLKAGYSAELISLARSINNGMPSFTVKIIQDVLNGYRLPVRDTVITVVGVTYKKNVSDIRGSPFFELEKLLRKLGADLRVYDSWYQDVNTCSSLIEALTGCQAMVIVTDHDDCIAEIEGIELSKLGVLAVVDGRNCLNPTDIERQGLLYKGIGRNGSYRSKSSKLEQVSKTLDRRVEQLGSFVSSA